MSLAAAIRLLKVMQVLDAGHVLVCPQRVVPRFRELNSEEIGDLW